MYNNLGIHWASMIPAFLALLCVPFPFVLYKYGPAIRARCKYAAEAAAFMDRIRNAAEAKEEPTTAPVRTESETTAEFDQEAKLDAEADAEASEKQVEEPEEAFDYNYEHEGPRTSLEEEEDGQRFRPLRTGGVGPNTLQRSSTNTSRHEYERRNPFDLDRVATRESFAHERPSARASARASARTSMEVKR
jgi:hypothetical protein